MKSHPHAHSHGIRSITFVLAISIHSIVEGLALGVQKDNTKVTSLFLSLMVHKLIVAFSVGLQLARTHAHALRWVIASIFIISVITPLGALIGMFVQRAPLDAQVRDILVLICQGIAVGTFIYVTFFEVLIHERDNEHPNLLKILFMIIGFTLIGCLRLLEGEHTHFEDNSYHSHDSIPGEVEHHHNH
uniref:Zinc transporter ZIP1 n=1 Tax=Panagrolaimus davidi TaxID=227884 RepID=A0A914P140_9BILA